MTRLLNQTQFMTLVKIRSANFTAGASKNESIFQAKFFYYECLVCTTN